MTQCGLNIQCFLPPSAPIILQPISNRSDTRDVEILHHAFADFPILGKVRQPRSVGVSGFSKVGDISLHDQCKRIILHSDSGSFVESISNVLAVESWRDAELVAISIRCEGPCKVVGIAGKDGLRHNFVCSRDFIGVTVCTVKDIWIQRVRNVSGHVIYVSCWERYQDDVLFESFWCEHIRRCEQETFICVMADQDFKRLVKLSMQKEVSR